MTKRDRLEIRAARCGGDGLFSLLLIDRPAWWHSAEAWAWESGDDQ